MWSANAWNRYEEARRAEKVRHAGGRMLLWGDTIGKGEAGCEQRRRLPSVGDHINNRMSTEWVTGSLWEYSPEHEYPDRKTKS